MSQGQTAATELEALSFEDILQRLEKVVNQLEQGDAPLERALAIFEQGVALTRAGNQRLDDAERRIEELLSDGSTRPLAASDDDSAEQSAEKAPVRTRSRKENRQP